MRENRDPERVLEGVQCRDEACRRTFFSAPYGLCNSRKYDSRLSIANFH